MTAGKLIGARRAGSVALFALVAMAGCQSLHDAQSRSALERGVEQAIARVVNASGVQDQQAALMALVTLGRPAVPYIVKHMDDRRTLPARYIQLENGPRAFEASRIYKPELVVDALAGVLNQITQHSFGYIYNGGSDAARDEAVAQWRQWCLMHYPGVRDGCVPGAF